MELIQKLHLGSGPHALAGFINLDIDSHPGVIQRDLTKGIGLAPDSLTFVYTEHFIEHVTFDHAVNLMGEVLHILRPGGVLRVSTPNLQTLVNDYKSHQLDRFAEVWKPSTPCQMVNEGMRMWGHQYLYDELEMVRLLMIAGVNRNNIYPVEWHKSAYRELQNLEVRPWRGDLIMEAVKATPPPVGPSYHARVPANS